MFNSSSCCPPEYIFGGQVEGTILRCSCSFFFLFGPLLHAKKLGVGGLQDFTVSPRPLGSENLLGFGWNRPWGFQGLRVWGQGLTIEKESKREIKLQRENERELEVARALAL